MVVLPSTGEPAQYNSNYIFYWNNVALELNRLTVTVGGSYSGVPSSARALGMIHLAMHDAYFAIEPSPKSISTYLDANSTYPDLRLPDLLGANDAKQAVAAAASTVMSSLYTTRSVSIADSSIDILSTFLQQTLDAFPGLTNTSSSYRFGTDVGNAIVNALGIQPDEPGFEQGSYRPGPGPTIQPGIYRFGDDPVNPIRVIPVDPNKPDGPQKSVHVYQAPFYGATAKRLAVQHIVDGEPAQHILADPPVGFGANNTATYNIAVDELYRQGGAASLSSTRRTPDQTTTGLYWAYDGTNGLGTPPRHYNQILRRLAHNMRPDKSDDPMKEDNNADFARLFALVNVALADAAVFAWQNKYCFEFWRPLSGIRRAPPGSLHSDPFWWDLGAPNTNSDRASFRPSFPSYPSGHATLGSAALQAMRLYYRARNADSHDIVDFEPDEPDSIAFDHISDEMNGINRDLRRPYNPDQPITDQDGTVRISVQKHFTSLWDAIFDNSISRVFLGVHWGFDLFAASDVMTSKEVKSDGTNNYKPTDQIRYTAMGPRGDRPGLFPIGGTPLGIAIANDIFQGGLRPTPPDLQPSGQDKCGDANLVAKIKAQRVGAESKATCVWRRHAK